MKENKPKKPSKRYTQAAWLLNLVIAVFSSYLIVHSFLRGTMGIWTLLPLVALIIVLFNLRTLYEEMR